MNRSGHDCPYSLQLIVCLLLYEITTFLRETYETLPKLPSLPTAGLHPRPQRTNTSQTVSDTVADKRSSDYLRMDSVISQVSNRSTLSLTNEQPSCKTFYFEKIIFFLLFNCSNYYQYESIG